MIRITFTYSRGSQRNFTKFLHLKVKYLLLLFKYIMV